MNIEHLHLITKEILDGKNQQRQMGRSIALLYLMLAKAMYVDEPENSEFLFIGRNNFHTTIFYDKLCSLLDENKISYSKTCYSYPCIITESLLKFRFISQFCLDKMKGIQFTEVYFDDFTVKSQEEFNFPRSKIL